MNNLKRILSLALASVMLVGMMVVGASAAEFTDGETIANNDAVDTLVSLNVIGGYDDGSFRPEGNVTRAQMAKMIATALHGGDTEYRGSSSGSQFTDVKDGMWYTKDINYCAGEGIINGRNATTFDPEGMVTATETAVMIMRAMGYRNETFLNEKGVYSPAAVDKLAETLGLYDDTTKLNDTSVALNRQNAAQILCNAIQLPTPVYRMTYNSEGVRTWSLESTDGETVLESAYNAKVEFAILDGSTYDAETGKFSYDFDVEDIEVKPLSVNDLAATTIDASDLYMQKVRVVYAGKDILGITAVGKNVLGTGVVGSMNEDEDKKGNPTIDGFLFDTGADEIVIFNGASATENDYDTYTLIDNDGDNKIDAIVVNPVVLETVDTVSNGVVTTAEGGEYTISAEDAADVDAKAYEGIAKGDFVTVSGKEDAKLPTVLTKVEVTENVQATASNANSTVYTIGGQKYRLDDGVTVTLGTSYDLVVVNGYVLSAVKHTDGSASNALDLSKVAYVTGFATDAVQAKDSLGNNIAGKYSQQVELLFTDGTKSIVEVVNFGVDGEGDPQPVDNSSHKVTANGLTAFSVKDGKYSLTTMADPEDYTKTSVTTKIENGRQGATRFNDSAVLFVAYTNANGATVAVLSGADINGWETATGTLTSSTLYAKKNSTGFNYVDLGAIDLGAANLPGAAATDFMYGYVTTAAVNAWNPDANSGNGATQPQVTIWNGTENITCFVNADGITAASLPRKALVKYQLTDGVMTSVEVLDKATLATTVDAYDNANIIVLNESDEYNLKDTIVLYIKEADATGRTTGTIRLARDGANNVYAVVEGTGDDAKLVALFVDVDNKVSEQPKAEEKPATCEHSMTKNTGTPATCKAAGTVDTWTCSKCSKTFIDENGTTEATDANKVDPQKDHSVDTWAPDDANAGSHKGTCTSCSNEQTGTCDTDGAEGACSKCGYKA